MKFEDHPDLVEAAAADNDVAVDLVWRILQLEPQFRNLHGYGNRPAFRRKLAEVVDAANPAKSKGEAG